MESSRTSLASRTHFEVLGLGLEGQVLGLGLEASSSRKLACPRLEDSPIFWIVKILWSAWKIFWKTFFCGDRLKKFCEDLFFLESTCACVLGPWPWPREFLSLASRRSVLGKAVLGLGLGFFCVLGLEPCVLDSTSACIFQLLVEALSLCKILVKRQQITISDRPSYDIFVPQKLPLWKIYDDVIACDLWFRPPPIKNPGYAYKSEIAWKKFFEDFLFSTLAAVSLVFDLERSCPWPRGGLSSERLFLALASDFFCVLGLGLEPIVSSTPPLWISTNFSFFD